MRDTAEVPVISVVNKGRLKTMRALTERLSGSGTVIFLSKSGGVASFVQRLVAHIEHVSFSILCVF